MESCCATSEKTPSRIAFTKPRKKLEFTYVNVSPQNRIYFAFLSFALFLLVAALCCRLSEASLLENCWDNWAVRIVLAFERLLAATVSIESVVLRLLKSLLLGSIFLSFTWGMVYIDSACPGIEPPTPLSPSNARSLSGHTFHSGYVLAVVNGLLCAIVHFLCY